MTPLQASVLLNEAIEMLEDSCPTAAMVNARARLVSFRDGFFRHIRTRNNHPVKIPAVPRPVFDHTRPEGLGVLVQQPKFAFGHIPSEHLCPNCREFGLDGCPNCPGFQEY